jgi:hypothetical protein
MGVYVVFVDVVRWIDRAGDSFQLHPTPFGLSKTSGILLSHSFAYRTVVSTVHTAWTALYVAQSTFFDHQKHALRPSFSKLFYGHFVGQLLLFPLVPPSSVGRLIIASLQIVIHREESNLCQPYSTLLRHSTQRETKVERGNKKWLACVHSERTYAVACLHIFMRRFTYQ